MNPEVALEMVHLQITRKCNMNCWFCGQRKFMRSQTMHSEMQWEDWKSVVDSLISYRKSSSITPGIMIWGGEPLLSEHFVKLVSLIHSEGFPLGMVTNGTLLDKQIDLCKEAFEKIYISVDGPEEIHDQIRGKGAYQKVKENMHKLKGGPELVNMAVLTPQIRNRLKLHLESYTALQPDRVILQEMIGLTKEEVECYKVWLKQSFGQEAIEIEGWEGEIDYDPPRQKSECITQLAKLSYPFEVTYQPHGIEAANPYCLSPFRHAHITWNGNVTFCTDFTDFYAGNVKEENLMKIFENTKSERFRQEIKNGNCITCQHCSWKNSKSFAL